MREDEVKQKLKERQEVWTRIQSEAPAMAQFLQQINSTFGKPSETHVWIGQEKVV